MSDIGLQYITNPTLTNTFELICGMDYEKKIVKIAISSQTANNGRSFTSSRA